MVSNTQIKPLTSLRFFFALAVFGHHCSFLAKEEGLASQIYFGLFYEGFIGVTFFFILSGFILSYAYQDRLLQKTVRRKQFYWGRFARIYPLHLFTFLLMVPVRRADWLEGGAGMILAKLCAQLSLTQSYWLIDDIYSSYNAPAWSISDEAFFYLLFPFLLMGIERMWRKWNYGVVALAAFFLIIPISMPLVPPDWQHEVFYVHPLVRLADFSLGVLLYQLWRRQEGSSLTRLPGTVAEILSLGLLAVFLFFNTDLAETYRYSAYYWGPMLVVIWVFAQSSGAISRLLSSSWLVYLGEISFAIYLIHRPVMRYYFSLKGKLLPFDAVYVDLLVLLCLTLLSSHLCYRYIERPSARWLKSGRRKVNLSP